MQTLSDAALNRATLARQGLLARERLGVVEAIERFGPLQAQEPRPPYLALWSRVEGFTREALHAALHDRTVVRATSLRATLHLTSAGTLAAIRPALAPAMAGAMSALRGRDEHLDQPAVLDAARELLAERPLTMNELRPALLARFPAADERALGYAVRLSLALVLDPTGDAWGFPRDPAFRLAEPWVGRPVAVEPAGEGSARAAVEALVRTHLAAFGPASAADVQTWSGVKGLKPVLEGMGDALVRFKSGRRTLYDLPDAPRPDPETPAPPRLLAPFDSLVLAHADRTRVVPEEHRPRLVTKNLRIPATFLLDGRVAGTWRLERRRVELEPFSPLARADADALAAEGEALAAFAS